MIKQIDLETKLPMSFEGKKSKHAYDCFLEQKDNGDWVFAVRPNNEAHTAGVWRYRLDSFIEFNDEKVVECCNDTVFLDTSQDWRVVNLQAAVKEASDIVNSVRYPFMVTSVGSLVRELHLDMFPKVNHVRDFLEACKAVDVSINDAIGVELNQTDIDLIFSGIVHDEIEFNATPDPETGEIMSEALQEAVGSLKKIMVKELDPHSLNEEPCSRM